MGQVNTALIVPPVTIVAQKASPWTQDEQDRMWLADRVGTVEQGLRAVAEAVVQISRNWNTGRRVGRFYPDLTPFEFVIQEIGPIRLPREARDKFIADLVDTGLSRRKAAALTGVGHDTANRASGRNRPPRKPPTIGRVLSKHVRGILAGRSTLPDELERWLASDPSDEEREAIAADLHDLAGRVADLLRKVTQ